MTKLETSMMLLRELIRKQRSSSAQTKIINLEMPVHVASFLALQLRGAKSHPANKSKSTQEKLDTFLVALLQAIKDENPQLAEVLLQTKLHPAGCTFLDLDDFRKEVIVEMKGVMSQLAETIWAMTGETPEDIIYQAYEDYAKSKKTPSPKDLELLMSLLEKSCERGLSQSGHSRVAEPQRFIVGFFFHDHHGQPNWNSGGFYSDYASAKTAQNLLTRIYPEPQWKVMELRGAK